MMIVRTLTRRRLAYLGCGAVVACFVAYIGLTVATGGFSAAGMHVSSDEANSKLPQDIDVPDSAADVNYSASVWMSVVDVKISEAAFLAWCQRKEWTVQRIPADDPSLRRGFHDDGTASVALINNGYWFSAREGDMGFSGVFDRDAERAFVMFTSR